MAAFDQKRLNGPLAVNGGSSLSLNQEIEKNTSRHGKVFREGGSGTSGDPFIISRTGKNKEGVAGGVFGPQEFIGPQRLPCLTFPEDLSKDTPSVVQFTTKKTVVTGTTRGFFAQRKPVSSMYINLPIPNSMVITQPTSWENAELGIAGNINFASLSSKSDSDPLASVVEIAKGVGGALKTIGDEIGAPTISALLKVGSVLTGLSASEKISLETRKVNNPRLEVLFKNVSFRTFSFAYKLSPKSQAESNTVKDIVKAFRYHAAPDTTGGDRSDRYLIYPSEFAINFLMNDNPHPALPPIGNAVCTNVDVNYTSAGQWVQFEDGQPVETELTLTFTETEIPTKTRISRETGFNPDRV